jgi:hypothetical protein
MKNGYDVENLLEGFSPRPAPSGLKERIIQTARIESQARQVLTPALRLTLTGSIVLTLFFILADWRISTAGQEHLSQLLNVPSASPVSLEKAADQEISEYLADLPDLDATTSRRLLQILLAEKKAAKASRRSLRLEEGIYEN